MLNRRHVPNLLGIFRIAGSPILVILILIGGAWGYGSAIALLLLMAISDIIDGRIARRLKVVSPLGIFLDTISDKIFVAAALIPMVEHSLIPAWAAFAIIAREFAVSGLRSYAAAEGEVISAGSWGKQKLTITVTALIWRLVDAALSPFGELPLLLSWLAALATLWPLVLGLALLWTIGS
ncbi:MAG TPA: CDP-alcohol phosphatidyltransferase family protein, partial [Roseiflexaceae bacterium]|nr:CDP-alcohol phosphatidyltransferase family protein [Roseiflexaceae bacterium]